MHYLLIFLAFLFFIPAHAQILLERDMTPQEMEDTGINNLTDPQREALEAWLNGRFERKEFCPQIYEEQIYLSLNVDNGSKLELSDGSTYEIAPADRMYTVYWITPFPIILSESYDPEYPIKITNMQTKTSVKGRRISTQKMLEEEIKKRQPPPPKLVPPRSPKDREPRASPENFPDRSSYPKPSNHPYLPQNPPPGPPPPEPQGSILK